MNLIDIYVTVYANTTENTYFSAAHGTFSERDDTIISKASLQCRKIEIFFHVFTLYSLIHAHLVIPILITLFHTHLTPAETVAHQAPLQPSCHPFVCDPLALIRVASMNMSGRLFIGWTTYEWLHH